MKNVKPWLFKALVILPALSLVFAVSAASVFAAATYPPSRTARCSRAPGASPDATGRLMAGRLTERLGRQVFVENYSGQERHRHGSSFEGRAGRVHAAPRCCSFCN